MSLMGEGREDYMCICKHSGCKAQKAALAMMSPEVQAGCWEEVSAAPS